MNRHTGGIILFILFNCLPYLCTAAAYGDNCTDTSECTDGSYLECNTDKKCSCSTGYIANGTVCNADLGTGCSNVVSCYDQNSECVGVLTQCSCKNTHYDDNGDKSGGTCQLKNILGEECPDPNTVLGTCSTGNSGCSYDDSSSTNYRCKCVSPNVVQNGKCVEATWSNWSNWESCSLTCGSGTRTRTRTCSVANSCTGIATESESCSNGVCPVDGIWGNWTPWSACSPTCGDSSGQRTRSRNCDSPAASNGGNECVGDKIQTLQCTISKCPVDGGLSEWSAWSSCSVSCAGGSQTRSRTCTNPTPQYDGKDCTGHRSETQACEIQACPGDLKHDI
ncbi:coadhesin-like [Ruditapes philippinarum]|uniref:coadhesin-like n=1 Tax=Ruditapes philippinarum TaxID=129788 RepID=UPI00295B5AD6|nr:coadhesin-like [Ruditapes philippinarum]